MKKLVTIFFGLIILALIISSNCFGQNNANFRLYKFNNVITASDTSASALSGEADGYIWYDVTTNNFRGKKKNGTKFTFGSGGGTATLTATQIGFGSGTNTLTGSPDLTYNDATDILTLKGTRFISGTGLFSNLFIGEGTGNTTLTGTANYGFGRNALIGLTDGTTNIAIGNLAGSNITSGDGNLILGHNLDDITTGDGNIQLGLQNHNSTMTGSGNVTIGYHSNVGGSNFTTGSGNIMIGRDIDTPSPTTNGNLIIQNILYGVGNTAAGTSVSTGQIGIGNNNPGSLLTITGNAANKNLLLVEEDAGTDILSINEVAGNPTITMFSVSAALDFASTAAQTSSDLTITVNGAAAGDMVILGIPTASTNNNSTFTARVSAANTVSVRFNNYSSAAIDPASGTFKVSVIK